MARVLGNDRKYPNITRLSSTRLRKIVGVIAKRGRLRSIPRPVMAVLVIALTLGWVVFAYGQTTNVPFHTIWWGLSGGGSRSNSVINDEASWSNLWAKIDCHPYWNLTYCPPAPLVNFTTRTVLVASAGLE